MNVVGKVGSLITQGVYSVATPFHPFGGAVDVIVVEQEDGTYRSTPWYVRFGKFQGVLKGAEKFVQISVNGVEANFHMSLDNSGEAYFVREAESRSSETDFGNDNSNVSDLSKSNINDNLDEKDDIFNENNNENRKVETNDQIYGFQDEHSSSEASVGSPSFTPYHYGSLDEVEDIVESSHNSNSEMVLISVDGHVLTAPISSTEGNTENVQLSTPQFHLGPGDSSHDDFGSDGDGWVAGILKGGQSFHDQGDTSTRNLAEITSHAEEVGPSLSRNDTFMSCIDFSEQTADRDDSDSQNFGSPTVVIDVDYRSRIPVDVSHPCIPEVHEEELSADDNYSDGADVPLLGSNLATTQTSNNSSNVVEEDKNSIVVDSCILQVHEDELSADDNYSDGANVPLLGSELATTETSQDTSNAVEEHKNNIVAEDSKENISCDQVSVNAEDNIRQHDSSLISDSAFQPSNGSPVMQVEREGDKNLSLTIENIDHEVAPSISNRSPKSNMEQEHEQVEGSTLKSVAEEGMWTSESQNQKKASSFGFEVSLCGNVLRAGMGSNSANEAFEANCISKEDFEANGPSIIKNKNLIVRFDGKYFRWDKAAPIVLGMAVFGADISIDLKDAIPIEQEVLKLGEDTNAISPSTRGWRLWPIPFRRAKSFEHANSSSSNIDDFVDSVQTEPSVQVHSIGGQSPRKKFIQTKVPTTEQIASLNLKDGQNMIAFSFCTRVLGKQQVDAHVYLWKWNARIVISDVDGTITRSDVLGQFMPLVGKDWSQSGVARLFCAIKENGYQLLFLSARAIVQAYLTRSFLLNLKQDGETLPHGPIVISPDGLFPSLYREVIRRAPHEFKIACLEDIKALFPADYNPFYAGFGNRDTDELSYRKIGIPKGKIFIINPKGEVAIYHRIDVKSYTSLHTLVNDMFPPTSLAEQEDYNSWNYWKMPLPTIDD